MTASLRGAGLRERVPRAAGQGDLPVHHCGRSDRLRSILDPLWNAPNFQGALIHGGCFWFTLEG